MDRIYFRFLLNSIFMSELICADLYLYVYNSKYY